VLLVMLSTMVQQTRLSSDAELHLLLPALHAVITHAAAMTAH
jgi:hypothetical protein